MFTSLAAVVCGWIAPRYPDRAPAAGARRLRAGIVGLIFVGLLLPSPAASAAGPPAAKLEATLPDGRHFQQASEYQGLGFDIVDLPTTPVGAAPLWSAVRARGGPTLLGYPLSRAFVGRDQCVYQILQRVILQACGTGQVQFANTFELLEHAGKDEWLAAFHSVPPPIIEDGSTSLQHAMEIRLGWLTNSALREAYLQPPNGEVATWSQADAINLYGLPMSHPVDYGPFVSQRFQRTALQWWKKAGPAEYQTEEVMPVLAGQLAVAAGLVADAARHPHAPGTAVRMPLPVIESWPLALSREPPPTIPPVPPAGYPDLPEDSVRMVDGQSQQSGGPRAYVVRPGDNGSVIYGVDMWSMLRTNGLSADELIHPGQVLRIPDEPELTTGHATGRIGWPARGWISAYFTSGHPSIDIAADHGVSIYAADGGVVRSAGWNSGYGNQVVIDHRNGYVTTYSHLSSFPVWPGQLVQKGAVIGRNGSTGHSTGPHLHFEVLHNGHYVNPLDFLR